MMSTSRRLQDSVVVITGASGGIGRAAARAFSRHGASLVLAARRAPALEEVKRECEGMGAARVVALPTDVSDEESVERLASHAQEEGGRIDVWVNNAAVSLFSRFEEAPSHVYRKVFETNLFGYIHGARAALSHFREQGAGVLINVTSVVTSAPQPYTSAYVATKYGIQGWSECLRMELALDDVDIHVCTVRPASIDTPLFQQAANYTGFTPKPLEPLYPPEMVAEAIVDTAEDPSRGDRMVGAAGRLMSVPRGLSRPVYERLAARHVHEHHLDDRPAPPSEGNLFQPMPGEAAVRGGWGPEEESDSRRNGRARNTTLAAAALLAAGGVTAYAISRSQNHRFHLG